MLCLIIIALISSSIQLISYEVCYAEGRMEKMSIFNNIILDAVQKKDFSQLMSIIPSKEYLGSFGSLVDLRTPNEMTEDFQKILLKQITKLHEDAKMAGFQWRKSGGTQTYLFTLDGQNINAESDAEKQKRKIYNMILTGKIVPIK